MMNLLPSQQKIALMRMYKERLFTAVTIVLGIIALFSAGLMAISYMYVGAEKNTLVESVALRSEEPSVEEGRIAEKDIAETKDALLMLSQEMNEGYLPAVIMQKVFSEQGNVMVEGVTYDVSPEGNIAVAVRGTAPSRSALVDFSIRLERVGFKGSRVPVSSFVEEFDIPFSLSMTL